MANRAIHPPIDMKPIALYAASSVVFNSITNTYLQELGALMRRAGIPVEFVHAGGKAPDGSTAIRLTAANYSGVVIANLNTGTTTEKAVLASGGYRELLSGASTVPVFVFNVSSTGTLVNAASSEIVTGMATKNTGTAGAGTAYTAYKPDGTACGRLHPYYTYSYAPDATTFAAAHGRSMLQVDDTHVIFWATYASTVNPVIYCGDGNMRYLGLTAFLGAVWTRWNLDPVLNMVLNLDDMVGTGALLYEDLADGDGITFYMMNSAGDTEIESSELVMGAASGGGISGRITAAALEAALNTMLDDAGYGDLTASVSDYVRADTEIHMAYIRLSDLNVSFGLRVAVTTGSAGVDVENYADISALAALEAWADARNTKIPCGCGFGDQTDALYGWMGAPSDVKAYFLAKQDVFPAHPHNHGVGYFYVDENGDDHADYLTAALKVAGWRADIAFMESEGFAGGDAGPDAFAIPPMNYLSQKMLNACAELGIRETRGATVFFPVDLSQVYDAAIKDENDLDTDEIRWVRCSKYLVGVGSETTISDATYSSVQRGLLAEAVRGRRHIMTHGNCIWTHPTLGYTPFLVNLEKYVDVFVKLGAPFVQWTPRGEPIVR